MSKQRKCAAIVDEIEKLLAGGGQKNDGGYLTREELVAATGISAGTLCKRLRAIHAAGRLESCRVLRTRIDGSTYPTPAYRVKS